MRLLVSLETFLMINRRVLVIAAIATVPTACTNSGSGSGTATVPEMAQYRSVLVKNLERSWMRPTSTGQALLYDVQGGSSVNIYTFPEGQLVGQLAGSGFYPRQLCVDPNTQNIWVISSENFLSSDLIQFAHGSTTQISTLHEQYDFNQFCSVDPTTGNLAAVTSIQASNDTLSVWEQAQGEPTTYNGGWQWFVGVAYDGSGNIFMTGGSGLGGKTKVLQELPQGSNVIKTLAIRKKSYGQLQWDGAHVALGDGSQIQRISGTKIVGTTTLTGRCNIVGDGFPPTYGSFFIAGNELVGAEFTKKCLQSVRIYKYPAGGAPIATLNIPAGYLGVSQSPSPHV